ncbi:hypothetical protein [Bradyrhizobium cajani]|uniref:Uncharacterized protein n=1 Tax=Bradyrhizobium cajani TaxID=1928661 RepID=A0A844T3Y3_9BRAD|nr:hypothetical protein [Bradyrhizobium cajani]MCP3368607.1 hypothetical protein [Bradyrhizobium cajani]MVT73597.1 hypothetical protein [Bradyrhizobium cajani]
MEFLKHGVTLPNSIGCRGLDDLIQEPAAGHDREAVIEIKEGRRPMALHVDGRASLVAVVGQGTAALFCRVFASSNANEVRGGSYPLPGVGELDGIPAYAFREAVERELHLVRDRLDASAVLPLHYREPYVCRLRAKATFTMVSWYRAWAC